MQTVEPSINSTTHYDTDEHWLFSSLDKFAEVLYFQEHQDITTWGDFLLQELIPYIHGLQAILYSKIDNELRFTSSYALDDLSKKGIRLAVTDGLLGEAIRNNEICYLTSPAIHYKPHVSTVSFEVEAVVIIPLAFNRKVCGVLEILFHQRPAQKYINLLQKLSERIAANLNFILIKENLELSHKEIEAKNEHIMASIAYAKRIQDAFLPSTFTRNTIFPNSFVIYRPVHIVSGDFYWFSQHDNLKIACIVDCTGHGIPGAFMSLVGNRLLNEAIINNQLHKPSEIIAWLHRGILQYSQNSEGEIRDGMDLGICVIEYLENEQVRVIYEGARHTLLLTKSNVVERHNSSRLNLGYSKKVFNVHDKEIMLSKNDMLYFTTDGYIDQSDIYRKRFGVEQFMELIAANHTKSVAEQHHAFVKALEKHSKNSEQIDDITVFGIRL